jgi:hypothetical protein
MGRIDQNLIAMYAISVAAALAALQTIEKTLRTQRLCGENPIFNHICD